MKSFFAVLTLLALTTGAFADCTQGAPNNYNCYSEISGANLTEITFIPTQGSIRVDFKNSLNLNKNFYFNAGSDMEAAKAMLAMLLTAKMKGYSIRAWVQYSGSSGYIWDNLNANYGHLVLVQR